MKGKYLLKQLEYSSKSILGKFFKPSFDPKIITEPANFPEFRTLNKILLLRHDRIGDTLVTSPFVRALRQIFPESEIHILMSPKNIGAKNSFLPFADKFHLFYKKLNKAISTINHLKKEKFDLIIDPYNKESTTNSFLIKFIKPKYSLGFWKENFSSYTHAVKIHSLSNLNIVSRIMQLVLAFGKLPDQFDMRPNFFLIDTEQKFAEKAIPKSQQNIGIVLSGSDRAKFWGIENITEFIKMINDKYSGYFVYLFATPDYQAELDVISAQTKSMAAPRSEDISHYAALLKQMDFIVSPDTSAVHFASSFSIPLVVLYNYDKLNNPYAPWYPVGVPYIAIEHPVSISELQPDDVFDNFIELVNRSRQP